jgi:asparagine synthase (glutamine-hydrolysing)
VLLSGGVDSSLITAMAVRASNQVRTFTVGFAGYGQYDESAHGAMIARHFGTQHVQLEADRISPDLLPVMAHQYDEPIVDSSMLPTFLLSRVVREHCTVALGGDGGDELFGGYPHYDRLLRIQGGLHRLPRPVRRVVAAGARHLLPTGFHARNWLGSLDCDLNNDLPLIGIVFDPTERRRLLGEGGGNGARAEGLWRAGMPVSDDLVERITRLEFATYLPEDILVKVDRASMLNSLEIRAPLLDVRMLEFAFGEVPARLKVGPRQRKILLKRLAAKLLPPQFDQRRKQGFSIPLGSWLRAGPWRDYFHRVLLDRESLFDRREVQRLLAGQERGRRNHERLFGLVLFELWRRDYGMSL